jgi:hypothetical protein
MVKKTNIVFATVCENDQAIKYDHPHLRVDRDFIDEIETYKTMMS